MKGVRRPSPALVIACIALFVALGGTGYAVVKLPRNSVGTKQLKKNAVTSPKVKDNAITGFDVNEPTLGQVPSAGNADTLDAMDSSAFAPKSHHHEGLVLVSTPWTNWVASNQTVSTSYFGNIVRFTSDADGFGGPDFLHLTSELPVALHGKRLRILGAELCYDATDSGLVLNGVTLRVQTHSVDATGAVANVFTDSTDRTDAACRRYMFSAPSTLTEEQSVSLMLNASSSVPTELEIGRTTFILEATGENATAPS